MKNKIAKREELLAKKYKHPTLENIETYKKHKNKVLSELRIAEREFYRQEFEMTKNDLRKSWKVIKNIVGKDQKNHHIQTQHFLVENKEVSDSFEVANIFNDYFIKVGSNLAEQIISDINPLSYVNHNHHTLFIPNIEEIEIKNIILTLKNTAAGHDDLPGSIMKECEELYITPLTYIINLSFSQGHFPDELKLAKVIPIYKSGEKQMIEKVSRSLDTGKIVVGVFLDLKKAFDTVDHKILLDKLYAHGLRNNIYEWFRSYLANRSQYVMYNNSKSETKHITHGVPQGSILGPLLFILYINDFSRASDLLFFYIICR